MELGDDSIVCVEDKNFFSFVQIIGEHRRSQSATNKNNMRTGGRGKCYYLGVNRRSSSGGVPLKKSFAQKIFGSNLFLKNQKIEFIAKTQYAELSSAYRNNGDFPSCNIVAQLYDTARTHFIQNSWRGSAGAEGYGERPSPHSLAALISISLDTNKFHARVEIRANLARWTTRRTTIWTTIWIRVHIASTLKSS